MKYVDLMSPENLFAAFDEFKRGKRKKEDVMYFEKNLEENIFELGEQLLSKTYMHGSYTTFAICDPKYRVISKASVRDRVVHHVLFSHLYEIFDKTFIFHSYSSRLTKGTHIGVQNFHKKMRKVSENFRKPCYALKCDIRKFFANINHTILMELLSKKVDDPDVLWLINNIITSYSNTPETGIPLGNVTSQLFANVYLNQLDRFIKHDLHVEYYFRYADDFVLLHKDKDYLQKLIESIGVFLEQELKLRLHPQKVFIRKLKQGIDFLGYVCFPYCRTIRTKTKKRMFKKFNQRKDELFAGERTDESFNQTLQSYLGILQHTNSYGLTKKLKILSVLKQEYESIYPIPFIPHEIAAFLGLI
jgi:retron-type reverse transcriptase